MLTDKGDKFIISNLISIVFLNNVGNCKLEILKDEDDYIKPILIDKIERVRYVRKTSIEEMKNQYYDNNIIGKIRHSDDMGGFNFAGFNLNLINEIDKIINYDNMYICYAKNKTFAKLLKLENSTTGEFALVLCYILNDQQ